MLLLAIALLVGGSLLGGLLALVLAVALLLLFVGGVRREPDAPAAQPTLRAADQLRSRTKFASVSSRAWIHACVELLRIRRRQHQLRSELNANFAPLGEAVHKDDDGRARALKRQAEALEQELIDAERRASGAIANARQKVRAAISRSG